jgi:WD40 repeat protein
MNFVFHFKTWKLLAGAFCFLLFGFLTSARALDFGINKVHYHDDLHWHVLETDHFEIYYYDPCVKLAQIAAQDCEAAFLKTGRAFNYVPQPQNKIPLFIYGTPQQFQETNITEEYLDEGVGGFTEVFKNRIVVPMDGSYFELNKVITHELTHAFQYNLIYGEGWRSINLFKSVLVPTWMMEGMAEWNAQHLDGQGEMVLRDAILNDNVLPLNLLNSFGHFPQVYTAYKESQSILDYVTQVYGPDKVPEMMKKMANNQSPDAVIKNLLGLTMDQLYENWHFYLKAQTWTRIKGLPVPEKYGEVLEEGVGKSAVSPDGRWIATLKRDELGILNTLTKEKRVLKNDQFNTRGSGLAWSPDGQFIAAVVNRDGENRLWVTQVKTKKTKEYTFKNFPMLFSPAWSIDQKYILFSGYDYFSTDLYRYELATGKLDRLTQSTANKSWVQYSTRGDSLFYLQEDSGDTSIIQLHLNEEGLPDAQAAPVTLGEGLDSITSLQTTEQSIYFTSNRNNKIFNLYEMDLNGGHLTQLTNTFTDTLSVSVSPDENFFYVCLYQKSKESLYQFKQETFERQSNPAGGAVFLANDFSQASKVIPDSNATTSLDASDPKTLPSLIPVSVGPTPSQPAPVSALQVVQATNLVQLQWTATESEETPVEDYRVYRATAPGAPFRFAGKTSNANVNVFNDFEVEPARHYFYYVTAENGTGESAPSSIVDAIPQSKIQQHDYGLKMTPDILLFLAGYDSSFGFVGGGVIQMSDYLGDHRISLIGNSIPTVQTGIQLGYEFSQWRTTVDFDFYYYQNYLQLYDIQSGNIVNQYRDNENGFDLTFTYPLDTTTRIEYGVGSQRFQGNPLYLQFNEGISNYNQNSTNWDVANFYRLAYIKDHRHGSQFWPDSGYSYNLTLLQSLPVLDTNVNFANVFFETQAYANFGFLNHLVWANRWVGITSQGPNPQNFFIGDDVPFQSYFTTIRGFGGQTFFGSNVALWNTELRYPLVENLNFVMQPLSFLLIKDVELAAFMDTGVVADKIGELPQSVLHNSVGTGIRFYSFLFQQSLIELRFDVAWRTDRNAPPEFIFNLAPIF